MNIGQEAALRKQPKRIGIMIVCIIFLLLLIGFAGRTGMSYVVQYRINAAVDLWQQSADKEPTPDVWQDMRDSVERALFFDQNNPELHFSLARLYFYRASSMDKTSKKSSQNYQQAMIGFRTVITLRPVWAYGYMNLLYAKISVGEMDAEMRQSLRQLIKLAPWEENTLSDIVKAAVYVWSYLDAQSQSVVKTYLIQVSEPRKGEVMLVLKAMHLKDRFCQQIVKGETITLCQ